MFFFSYYFSHFYDFLFQRPIAREVKFSQNKKNTKTVVKSNNLIGGN